MDKVNKFFQKLSAKERAKFLAIKKQIKAGNFENVDIKSIKSKSDLFRVRLGRYRLVFAGKKSGKIELLKIVKRDEQTYKNL